MRKTWLSLHLFSGSKDVFWNLLRTTVDVDDTSGIVNGSTNQTSNNLQWHFTTAIGQGEMIRLIFTIQGNYDELTLDLSKVPSSMVDMSFISWCYFSYYLYLFSSIFSKNLCLPQSGSYTSRRSSLSMAISALNTSHFSVTTERTEKIVKVGISCYYFTRSEQIDARCEATATQSGCEFVNLTTTHLNLFYKSDVTPQFVFNYEYLDCLGIW